MMLRKISHNIIFVNDFLASSILTHLRYFFLPFFSVFLSRPFTASLISASLHYFPIFLPHFLFVLLLLTLFFLYFPSSYIFILYSPDYHSPSLHHDHIRILIPYVSLVHFSINRCFPLSILPFLSSLWQRQFICHSLSSIKT